jgi:hypothetical protein
MPPPSTAALWRRFALIHLLQLPAVALVLIAPSPWVWWPAALWGSAVACFGTDSPWRWINILLIAEAVVWLSLALSLTTPIGG